MSAGFQLQRRGRLAVRVVQGALAVKVGNDGETQQQPQRQRTAFTNCGEGADGNDFMTKMPARTRPAPVPATGGAMLNGPVWDSDPSASEDEYDSAHEGESEWDLESQSDVYESDSISGGEGNWNSTEINRTLSGYDAPSDRSESDGAGGAGNSQPPNPTTSYRTERPKVKAVASTGKGKEAHNRIVARAEPIPVERNVVTENETENAVAHEIPAQVDQAHNNNVDDAARSRKRKRLLVLGAIALAAVAAVVATATGFKRDRNSSTTSGNVAN